MRDDLQASPVRDDGLQLSEDRRLQRRLWRIERAAWSIFGAVIIAALLGLTGSGGYLSTQIVRFNDGTVEMPRIARWQTTETVVVEIAGRGERQVAFGPPFVRNFIIQNMTPEPAKSVAADGVAMQFHAGDGGVAKLMFSIRPITPGWHTFDIALSGDRAPVTIFVLP